MKFNIVYLLQGPAGTIAAPNKTNPIESPSLKELLQGIAVNLPEGAQLGIRCLGIEVKPYGAAD